MNASISSGDRGPDTASTPGDCILEELLELGNRLGELHAHAVRVHVVLPLGGTHHRALDPARLAHDLELQLGPDAGDLLDGAVGIGQYSFSLSSSQLM